MSENTQPGTPQQDQPIDQSATAPIAAHPTNPFLPPHPAAPADLRAQYEARLAQEQAQAAAYGAAPTQPAPQAQPFAPPQPVQPTAQPTLQIPAQHPAQHPAQQPAQQPAFAYAQAAQPGDVPTQPPGTTAPRGRRSIWLPVASVGVVAALGASLGTGALLGAFDDDASARPATLASVGTTTTTSVPVSGSTSDNPDWEAVTSAVQASVVAIQVTTSSGQAEGSGVIIDAEGHIITNNHVVEGAEGDTVQVTLSDGRLFDATIVGTDATTDLAVVQLKDAPDDLSPAALGDSDAVSVGEAVMAVGNPLGLANTVTTGIVSAVDRPVSTSESGSGSSSAAVVTNAIQIDAAVNPGNSGGPLFDAQGKVIGITSSIATTSSDSGSIGIGFAIPVNLVSSVASQLIASGTAEHAFLGVSLSDGTATADGVTRRGAVVEQVSTDSPASAAGLQKGDTIVAIGGKSVGGAESLTAYVRALSSGTKVTLTVVRDGAAIDVDVTLAARQETPTASSDGSSGSGSIDPQNMTPQQLWEWFQQQQSQQQGSGQ
ncbi:S1C family serine protease [Cellulomonas soli]